MNRHPPVHPTRRALPSGRRGVIMARMKRALLICPGRGSYNATELGYLSRGGRTAGAAFVERADELRTAARLPTISSLDGASRFDPERHLRSRHAAPLIFTAAAVDAALISQEYEIVAVAGNSMGWYIALYVAGALSFDDAFHLIQTMAILQEDHSAGGQIIYPLTDEQWLPDPAAIDSVERALAAASDASEPDAFWSIRLGGYAVLAGTDAGVHRLMQALPPVKRGGRTYPMPLVGHAAYHTPLLQVTSDLAVERLSDLAFAAPSIPLIDGRGHIFKPYIADPAELYGYTFVLQVTQTYDFTHSVRVGLREFGPDCIILLGPGEQLGGAIGQVLVADSWAGMTNRETFSARQKSDPFLLSMGRADQFEQVTGLAISAAT